jgi:predicted phosphoadenosine phosphosulfate sulfurtransferase
MARCILRNDFYCKGLGQTQPKSEAYEKFKSIKAKRKLSEEIKEIAIPLQVQLFQ